MLLVVGDVVRDHRDSALGIVAGLAEAPGPNLVVVRMSGGFVRLCEPHVLHLVARRSRPLTKSQSIAVVIAVLGAVTAAYLAARAVYEMGAPWLLVSLTGLGGYFAVRTAYYAWAWLTRPRPFRV